MDQWTQRIIKGDKRCSDFENAKIKFGILLRHFLKNKNVTRLLIDNYTFEKQHLLKLVDLLFKTRLFVQVVKSPAGFRHIRNLAPDFALSPAKWHGKDSYLSELASVVYCVLPIHVGVSGAVTSLLSI